jgi:uncharacterized caspase-like protein
MFGRLPMMAAIVAAWLSMLLAPAPALADKKVALVIGNAAYQTITPLKNPAEDARAVAQMLRDAGFDFVDLKTDLDNADFRRAVRDFTLQANQADVAVIYFSGHGFELYGTNYLIPVDAHLASDLDADDEAMPLERLVSSTDGAKQLRLIILDACRPNAIGSAMRRDRREGRLGVANSAAAGFGASEPARRDTLIAYAAKAGTTSVEGDGEHSMFTAALLKRLTVPGLDLRLALGRVRDDVMKATANRQQPFVYGAVYVEDTALAPPSATAQDTPEDIKADYELVQKIGTAMAYDVFLKSHPAGEYADRARAKLKELSGEAPSGSR